LILCEEISDDSFAYLIKSLHSQFGELDFSNLSGNKIGTLIENKKLLLSENNYEILKEHFNGYHLLLIEQNPSVFIEAQKSYSIDKDDCIYLLESTILTTDEKVKVIQNEYELILVHNELCDIVIDILCKYQYIPIDFIILKGIITNSYSDEYFLIFFAKKFKRLKFKIASLL